MEKDQESAVIACSLEQADPSERRDRWRRLAERAGVGVLTTGAGLRLLFRDRPGVEGELHQLAALERDCCAFADWSVQTRGDDLVLDVTQPAKKASPPYTRCSTTSPSQARPPTASPSVRHLARTGRDRRGDWLEPSARLTRRVSDGKEGVDGSSPSEGFLVSPAQVVFSFSRRATVGVSNVHAASTNVHRFVSAR
jgi:hypothetical protein